MCSTYDGRSNETAATIIYRVAQAVWGVSPKVILVMPPEKEQGLVTSTAPEVAVDIAPQWALVPPDTAAV